METPNVCLDTSVLIAYLKGREPGASAVEHLIRTRSCHVTTITVYELMFGVARAQRQVGEEELLGCMTIQPLDRAAAATAASLHDLLIRRNKDIGVKDVLIAAICIEHQLPLLTSNVEHFSRVPGLEILRPDDFIG